MNFKNLKKDFRTTVTLNSEINKILRDMGTSPQKILDEYIKNNITLTIGGKNVRLKANGNLDTSPNGDK